MPRPWKRPTTPSGPLSELNRALHELHHRAGWPSSREIRRALDAKGVLISHTKVHDTLTKPALPTKGAVEMITEVLAEKVRGADVNAEIDRILGLWQEASLEAPSSSHATSERPQSEVSPLTAGPSFVEKKEEPTQSRQWVNPWQQKQRKREQAEAGDPDAMVNLGILLVTEGSLEEAEHWLGQAAEKGDARAMLLLGALLAEADRLKEAESWRRRAADTGDTNAMNNLGLLIEEAIRVAETESLRRRRAWEMRGR